MKLSEAIEKVNIQCDNTYDDTIIRNFIEDCDIALFRDCVATHIQKVPISFDERYPLNLDSELIAQNDFSNVYIYFAIANIYLLNGDTERYNNYMMLYNTKLYDFKAWYNRTFTPLPNGRIITN